MKKLTNEQIMDYLDGALAPAEMKNIEAHLDANDEDAECIRELQMALGALKEWDAREPVQVSDNFWPSVREKLGPAPKRSLLSQMSKSLAGLFGPAPTARWSLGAAVAIVVIAIGVLFMGPQGTTKLSQAELLSPADQAFITQSVERHKAYIASQPIVGDVTSAETGADDDDTEVNR